jgi:hypothetical protein
MAYLPRSVPLKSTSLKLLGRRLIDAFLKLKNDKLRGAVADLAHVLAQGKLG